jgi:hypothetical protein
MQTRRISRCRIFLALACACGLPVSRPALAEEGLDPSERVLLRNWAGSRDCSTRAYLRSLLPSWSGDMSKELTVVRYEAQRYSTTRNITPEHLERKAELTRLNGRPARFLHTRFTREARSSPGPYYWRKEVTRKTRRTLGGKHRLELADSIDPDSRFSREIRQQLDLVFDRYLADGIVTPSEVQAMREAEAALDPRRLGYVFYVDKTGRPRFALRFFDESPLEGIPAAPLPLRKHFPGLKLDGPYNFEIGRGAKDPLIESDMHQIFHDAGKMMMDRIFFRKPALPLPEALHQFQVYAEVTGKRVGWYVREHGFGVVGGTLSRDELLRRNPGIIPEERAQAYQFLSEPAGIAPDESGRFVIRMEFQDFLSHNWKAWPFPQVIKTPLGPAQPAR